MEISEKLKNDKPLQIETLNAYDQDPKRKTAKRFEVILSKRIDVDSFWEAISSYLKIYEHFIKD